MLLSLSVRIVETECKTKLRVPLEELVGIAFEAGYQAICMRASAAGVDTPSARRREIARCIESAGLRVSMVTADFNVPLNNGAGPNSLRNIGPSLDVAESLGCNLVRVCLKERDDIPFARSAADEAARRGIRLAHQCHTTSLFEQVQPMLAVLAEIDRPNFGLTYEPANLMLCGESYGLDSLELLRPHLLNVYVQNHRLDRQGPVSLPTYCRGEVRFHHLAPWDVGGIDFGEVATGLAFIGYAGYFTLHQAQGIENAETARDFAMRCGDYFRKLLGTAVATRRRP